MEWRYGVALSLSRKPATVFQISGKKLLGGFGRLRRRTTRTQQYRR